MNSFQQACPSCQSSLELPIEADGKSAVCPACQSQFIAGAPGKEMEPHDHAELPLRTTSVEAPKEYRRISIENVWDDSRSVFQQRSRPLLLPFLILSVLAAIGLSPLIYLNSMAVKQRTLAMIWLAVLSPWFLSVISYSIWYALRLANNVCDAGPKKLSDVPSDIDSHASEPNQYWLVPNGRQFIFSMFMLVVIAFGFQMIVIGISTAMIKLSANVQAQEIRILLLTGAFAVFVICLLIVGTRFWPLFPLMMRARFGSQAIRQSLAITRVNLMTSFLLVIAIFFLLGFGFGMFGLGLPLVVPLAALTSEVALRLIEGRRISTLEPDEF